MVQTRTTLIFFFFNDTATTEIYTLSLHDALPIFREHRQRRDHEQPSDHTRDEQVRHGRAAQRSEEHTSELQSRLHLVCRLLLEKKKNKYAPLQHLHPEHSSQLATRQTYNAHNAHL